MNTYKKTALALFALTIMGLGAPLAAAQSSGILYQYSAGMVSLETDDIAIKVTGNDTDNMIGAPFVLPTVGWDFSGFETVEDNGNTTEVHFNFTTEATFDPRPEGTGTDYGNLPSLASFDVNVSVNVHMNLSLTGEFKFDLVVEGWSWTYEDSILVLMFTVTESAHGQSGGDTDPTGFHKVGTKFQFENGYFEYEETALAATNTLQVKASFGDATGDYSGNAVYLSFENFGDDTLEYDPILGILPSEPGILDPMTIGIVGGVAVIAILAIVLVRRK